MCKEAYNVCFSLTAFFVVLSNLFYFGLGCAEAYYVGVYDNLNGECRNIREWMIASATINITLSVLTCCGLLYLSDAFSNEKRERTLLEKLCELGKYVIAIWSIVTFYGITPNCLDFWEDNAPELWLFVVIHFVGFWVSLGIIGLLLISACVSFYGYAVEEIREDSRSSNANTDNDKEGKTVTHNPV